MDWKGIQRALKDQGFDPGPIDGVPGRMTISAVRRFQTAKGLLVDGIIGPQTIAELFRESKPLDKIKEGVEPPWMALLAHKMGLHETKNRAELAAFLRSDGSTLGDPSKNPWCGDLVETVLALTLPQENLPTNPYLARNWGKFGVYDPQMSYGCVAAFWRGSKSGTSGHVGFPIGVNRSGTRIRLRGGNQSNMIGDVWIDKERLLDKGTRRPVTWPGKLRALPILTDSGGRSSQNEI